MKSHQLVLITCAAALSVLFTIATPGSVAAADKPKQDKKPPTRAQPRSEPRRDSFDPVSAYEKHDVRGWTVYVNKKLLKEKELAEDALDVMKHQLWVVVKVIPKPALEKLRETPIWLELKNQGPASYHPDARWLQRNGYNPIKVRSIEIGTARSFVRDIHRHNVMLHELCHAYHHRVLGFDNKDIIDAYKSAMAEKKYDKLLNYGGRRGRAYAATNHKEYFAETTEAYFRFNDFYPFVRAELKEHDPKMYAVIRKVWGITK